MEIVMTSQENVVDIESLKDEAKELGMSGWQACKDPEKLLQKIEEFKESGKRKKAPKLRVAGYGENSRSKLIAELERDDPDAKYILQAAGITPEEASIKGMEIVKKANGDVMYCGNDIVCRTDKESYNEWVDGRNNRALNAMKSIDRDLTSERGGKKIQSLKSSPKTGV
jgi:hypothetical protein